MSDYRRFVSYIYNYEMKIKKNNVGFARIEIRGNQCKITLHMQVKSISSGALKAYGFIRDGNYLKGVFLEELVIKNGNGDAQVVTDKGNIKGSGISFEQLGGLIFYVSDDKYFGTEWDDIPLVFQELVTEKNQHYTIQEKSQERISMDKTKDDTILKHTEERNTEPKNTEAEYIGVKNTKEDAILETETEAEETPYTEQVPEEILEAAALPAPVFIPCTKEELKSQFGYEINNNFVLHGYNRFGHLGTMEVNDKCFLGVPGIFCKREQAVAENAGYGNFFPRAGGQLHYGDFGYWYDSMEYLK